MTEPLVLVEPGGDLQKTARAFGLDAHPWDVAGGEPLTPARVAHLAQGADVLFVTSAQQERESYKRASAAAIELGRRTWVLRVAGAEDLVEQLLERDARRVLEAAVPVDPPRGPKRFVPFPCAALPRWCRTFVEESAAAMDIDPAFVAVPLLGALAGAIGNSRRVRLKRFYQEPAVLWTVTVARSGSMKSPPLDLVLRPLQEADREAIEATQREHAKYEEGLRDYERELSRHRRGEGGELPEKPERPARRSVVVDDINTEALAVLLADNPRGLLMARAELSGWVHGMDAYRGGRGGDREKFLEMHGAKPLKVDRKTGDRQTIYVPRAALSIVGTIQPRVLAAVFDEGARGSGLAARLFMTRPPERPSRWTEDEVRQEVATCYRQVVRRLIALTLGEDGEPIDLRLTADAYRVWRDYHDASEQRRGECEDEDLCAAISKLRGGAARLALVVALARAAESDAAGGLRELALQDMAAGIELATWFAGEADRIYYELSGAESKQDLEQRRLVEWIERRRGPVLARHLQRNLKAFKEAGGAERAEKALAGLVAAGVGRWKQIPPGPEGGRPTRAFVLEPPSADGATQRDTDTTGPAAAAGAGSVAEGAPRRSARSSSVAATQGAAGSPGAARGGRGDETQRAVRPPEGSVAVAGGEVAEDSWDC